MIKSIKYGVDLINDVSGFKYDQLLIIKIKKIQHRKNTSSYARNTKTNAEESKV